MSEASADSIATVAPRLVSVDAMRGATMALMIVVNNPGSWGHMYAPLRHAPWGGWLTPADLVFPFFLFLVGVATPLALSKSRQGGARRGRILRRALRRAAVLFAIGLFLNLFPDFALDSVRIPGVLQRIALVYVGCAAAFLWLGSRGLLVLTATLAVGYALLLSVVPVPGVGEVVLTPETNLPVWLDERLFGNHTWRGPGDPEGLLSTLGAMIDGLVGVLTGRALRSERGSAPRLAAAGGGMWMVGAAASRFLPAVKEVWTSSYALISSGLALVALAGLRGGLDRPGPRTGLRPLVVLGRHALTAYVLAHLFSDLSIHVLRVPWVGDETLSLHSWIHRRALASWMPPKLASLGYSLVVLGLVWTLVWLLDRRHRDQEKRSPTSSIRS